MKAKELPGSLYHSARLRLSKPAELLRNKNTIPVIVSLTSIESRLDTLDIVIKSLFSQTILPKKILLWLNVGLKDKVSARLSELQNTIFEIRYCDLECSHKKLVLSMVEFPSKPIVICDDDFIYKPTWLACLYQDYQQYPRDIIANEVRKIRYDKDGALLPYIKWSHVRDFGVSGACYMGVGYGGVLYPPKCFHNDVLNQHLFLSLTPRADDLWFKMMSYLHGTVTRRAREVPGKPIPIAGTQSVSLYLSNVKKDKNRDQWLALSKYYNFVKF